MERDNTATKIKVNLDNGYDIIVGLGILREFDFRPYIKGKYAIVTDSNVRKLYGWHLESLLKKQGLDGILIEFPAGEKSKSAQTALAIGQKLAQENLDRQTTLIALGGGVVGDLAGYVASFYMRGLKFIQIPTTLLAQVDSSIGGKVGVNIPEGKNMFGYFHQPKVVITDIDTLKTLPEKELRNGLAEVIKYGVIQDVQLLEDIEQNFPLKDEEFLRRIIEKSCKIKVSIVEQDEKEENYRQILNYGHTIGHAIETAENYEISHGEAVAIGMAYEGKIALKLGLFSRDDLDRQNKVLQKVGLPIKMKLNPARLMEIMRLDKKAKNNKVKMVLPMRIGKVKQEGLTVSSPVDERIIRECLGG